MGNKNYLVWTEKNSGKNCFNLNLLLGNLTKSGRASMAAFHMYS